MRSSLLVHLAILSSVTAFVPNFPNNWALLNPIRAANSGNPDDPTKTAVASFANVLGNFINASPLAEGKKALVSFLAGPYDVAATQAKLNSLISGEKVLMLSFTK